MRTITEADVRAALARVMDPEIPTCSITDLGLVERVAVTADGIEVDLLPTFSGCPALEIIRADADAAIRDAAPAAEVTVRFVMHPAWTTDRITRDGHDALREYGIAGARGPVPVRLGRPENVACPYCGAVATEQTSAFGPTPCRAIRYCPSCRNPFEAFKHKGDPPA